MYVCVDTGVGRERCAFVIKTGHSSMFSCVEVSFVGFCPHLFSPTVQLKAHHVNHGAIRSWLLFLSSVMKTNKKPACDKGGSKGNEMNSVIKVCSCVGLRWTRPRAWMCLSAPLYFDLVGLGAFC